MKVNIISTKNLVIISLILLISGCFSSRKASTSSKSISKDQFVTFENNIIKDPVSNYTWTYFTDNPTTFFRFKMNNGGSFSRLPTVESLLGLFEKVSYQLNDKKDAGNIRSVSWFDADCDFLASSSTKTNEGEVLYEVIRWNAKTKTAIKEKVTGGDLVYILLLNEN